MFRRSTNRQLRLPLNWQLTVRGARLIETTVTAARYKLYQLAGGPLRLGLVRQTEGGRAIEVEVWRMPVERLGSFLAEIPSPLGLGKVELSGGRFATGFICEASAVGGADDITDFSSWRTYFKQQWAHRSGTNKTLLNHGGCAFAKLSKSSVGLCRRQDQRYGDLGQEDNQHFFSANHFYTPKKASKRVTVWAARLGLLFATNSSSRTAHFHTRPQLLVNLMMSSELRTSLLPVREPSRFTLADLPRPAAAILR